MKNINELNIANLTALWTKVAELAGNYKENNCIEISSVKQSEWPNKIWTKHALTTEILNEVKEQMASSEVNLVFPNWDLFGSDVLDVAGFGFVQKSEQTGMSLQLDQSFELSNLLTFKRVSNVDDAKLWSSVYPRCFGYVISEEILVNTNEEIAYYLFYSEGEIAGTAIYYASESVIGIHGVGIIPEMRKKGFAEEIMQILLNKAIAEGVHWATLQASPLGKGIYKRLGFTEDFTIKNYGL